MRRMRVSAHAVTVTSRSRPLHGPLASRTQRGASPRDARIDVLRLQRSCCRDPLPHRRPAGPPAPAPFGAGCHGRSAALAAAGCVASAGACDRA